jgi:hypothetical protein
MAGVRQAPYSAHSPGHQARDRPHSRQGQGGGRRATDDPRLEAEGQRDQAASNLKQAGEKVKDAFR